MTEDAKMWMVPPNELRAKVVDDLDPIVVQRHLKIRFVESHLLWKMFIQMPVVEERLHDRCAPPVELEPFCTIGIIARDGVVCRGIG